MNRSTLQIVAGALLVTAAQMPVPALGVENFEVVTCTVPGEIRRLGAGVTYVTPRRVVRTTAGDCEVFGGEYLLEDPASYSAALDRWREPAARGDAKAQYYLGQLYEKGAAGATDYELAAVWYRKSAEQGFGPAAINLGRLYEEGLGLERDSTRAAQWYAKAAGLDGDSVSMLISGDSAALVSNLQDTVAAQEREIEELRGELQRIEAEHERLQQKLRRREQAAEEARRDLEQLQQSIEFREQQLARESGDTAAAVRFEQELAELRAELGDRRREVAQRDAELESLRRRNTELEAKLHDLPAPSAGNPPIIEFIDPPLIFTGGSLSIALDPNEPDARRVITGKVNAPRGLQKLTVNGEPVPADGDGRFSTRIPKFRAGAGAGEVQIEVVALDKAGQRGAVTLFVSQTPRTEPERPQISASEFGQYYALVIGNDVYDHWPDLNNAVRDAETVATVLQRHYAFRKVDILRNATRSEILSKLNDIRVQLTEKDNLLVYYAGHGHLEEKIDNGYWIPVDAGVNDLTDWISNHDITAQLALANIKHVLVVADSCYAGTLSRSTIFAAKSGISDENRIRMLKLLSRNPSRTVLSSGGVRPVLDSGGGQHSVFARAFIDVLEQNTLLLETERIFQAVQERVALRADTLGVEQVPTYHPIRDSGHEGGQFLFIPKIAMK